MATKAEPRLLGGWYELEHKLGAGGMAEVYLATDRTLGRQVAAKLLAPPYAADPAFVARFEREARAASGLSHAHVVQVFDAGVADGTPFLVMEYMPGPSLRELLQQRGPLPEADALRLAA